MDEEVEDGRQFFSITERLLRIIMVLQGIVIAGGYCWWSNYDIPWRKSLPSEEFEVLTIYIWGLSLILIIKFIYDNPSKAVFANYVMLFSGLYLHQSLFHPERSAVKLLPAIFKIIIFLISKDFGEVRTPDVIFDFLYTSLCIVGLVYILVDHTPYMDFLYGISGVIMQTMLVQSNRQIRPVFFILLCGNTSMFLILLMSGLGFIEPSES